MSFMSIADANRAVRNHRARYEDFPVGTRVKVVCFCQDMYFFFPEKENLKGTVIRNSGKYLGIIVQWDEPRHYEGGHIQTEFNFEPRDMVLLTEEKEMNAKELYEWMKDAMKLFDIEWGRMEDLIVEFHEKEVVFRYGDKAVHRKTK